MKYINTVNFNGVIPLKSFNIGSKYGVIKFEHLDFSEIFNRIKKEQKEYNDWIKELGW